MANRYVVQRTWDPRHGRLFLSNAAWRSPFVYRVFDIVNGKFHEEMFAIEQEAKAACVKLNSCLTNS